MGLITVYNGDYMSDDKTKILKNYTKPNKKTEPKYIGTSVLITREQKMILEQHNINISKYLRDSLDELIKILKQGGA